MKIDIHKVNKSIKSGWGFGLSCNATIYDNCNILEPNELSCVLRIKEPVTHIRYAEYLH